jgi:hypothetical protein
MPWSRCSGEGYKIGTNAFLTGVLDNGVIFSVKVEGGTGLPMPWSRRSREGYKIGTSAFLAGVLDNGVIFSVKVEPIQAVFRDEPPKQPN